MPLDVLGRPLVFACLMVGCWFSPGFAQTADGAGRIKVVAGSATIVRAGSASPARVGALVYQSDTLRTGTDGRLAMTLRDETRLSMGPNTEITLSAFAFAPAEGQLSMVLRIARGALAYVSGRIAKLMPQAVRLETPTSVIGVRGTHALIRVEAP
jgi:hypothetical protein